jgi:hypothetical protein
LSPKCINRAQKRGKTALIFGLNIYISTIYTLIATPHPPYPSSLRAQSRPFAVAG